MASLTKYAGTISQTTGGKYAQFSNLANLKNSSGGSWATTVTVKGKSGSPNRPSTLSLTNFGFGLPVGAEVTGVTVNYRHMKTGSCTVGAPTISLLGVSGFSGKGVAPSKTTMTTSSKSFSGGALTRTVVNSSSFGVKVDYPANSGTGEGTISVSYVAIKVDYIVPSYSLGLKRVSGGYNNEKYTLQASISNKNLTSYSPTLTLTAPTGFSFSSASGSGTYTKVNARTITWNPKLTSKIGTASLDLEFDVNVTYPVGSSSYSGTFTLVESLYSTTESFSATITDRPAGEGSETDPDAPPFVPEDEGDPIFPLKTLIQEEPIIVKTTGTDGYFAAAVYKDDGTWEKAVRTYGTGWPTEYRCTTDRVEDGDYSVYYNEEWHDNTSTCYPNLMVSNVGQQIQLKINTIGFYFISVAFVHSYLPTTYYFLKVIVIPSEDDLTVPFFSILEPSEEELNRLGSGYNYIAQSDMNVTTTDASVRDWYKNNRIGVFNNALFSDDGTSASHNDMWTVTNGTMTRESTYTRLVESTNPLMCQLNSAYITPNSTVELDICQVDGLTNYAPLYVRNSAGNSSLAYLTYSDLGADVGDWVHIKIVFNDTDTITIYASTLAEPLTKTLSSTGTAYRLLFYGGEASTELHFKNFKIGSDNPTLQEMFSTAEYWSKATAGLNEYENCECEFTYNSDYPLYILLTGDYPEAEDYGYDMGTIKYDTPCIVEKEVYNSREPSGNYPIPITALLDNEEPSVITLAPNESTKGVILYDLPLEDDFGTNEDYAIRGIQVRADIDSTDNLVVYAKIHSPNGEIGQRSIVLNGSEEEIILGGLGDLWGFTTLQLTNLDDWELELSASNLLNSGDSEIVFNNVNITFYLETVEKQQIRVTIDGEDLAYYGAFIEKVDIPEGLETDTSFLTIDGTDTNDAYRQNIREKKIGIEFNLSNCDLETSTNMLRQLTKLFVNEKDQYNRPIPKRLQFTHYPTDYFEYIMEEPFDVETDITDYTVKATLTIPSGTSYSLDDTVTNTVGNANGLAAINPIIHFRPSDTNIQIKETISEQSFQMGYAGEWSDYVIELDCEDRRVYLIKDEDTKVDISKYVDHNSDWFRLSGEFEFEGINCTILTVTFNERW